MLKKKNRNCKQRELKTGVSEVIGVVKLSETKVCAKGQKKDESDSRSEVYGKSVLLPFG
jgi:hypothetical protein